MFAATKSSRVSSGSVGLISRSLRFDSASTTRLTAGGFVGSRRKLTLSAWVKRSALGSQQYIWTWVGGAGNAFAVGFSSSDQVTVSNTSGTTTTYRASTSLYRDVGAWYHIVAAVDSEQATANNRVRVYVNGVEVTSFATTNNPALNADLNVNNGGTHYIGSDVSGFGKHITGYLANIHYIDGQQLAASDFGEVDAETGVWAPKLFSSGAYGLNGFWLTFADNSAATAAALGKDDSGNVNNFTPANISVAAGAGNDSVTDTPTPYNDGAGNYCTLSQIDVKTTVALANGNLQFTSAVAGHVAVANFEMSTGKWYWEAQTSAGTTSARAGVIPIGGGTASAVYSFAANATVYGFRFDADAGTLDYTTNGSSWTSLATGLTAGPYTPYFTNNNTVSKIINVNFGQQGFNYAPPTGYKALNTFNLPDPLVAKGSDYFEPLLYTGTNATLNVTGLSFTPDLVWLKLRTGFTAGHSLFDSVRGTGRSLASNSTSDESVSASTLTAFNSDGFTLAANLAINASGTPYASWNWKKGATPGFDIVTYTGNGAGRTIAHSLGDVPMMMVVKARTTAGTDRDWVIYHGSMASPAGSYLNLNTTGARTTSTTVWNNTAPTSSVFSVGNDSWTNQNGDTFVAYLWSEVSGFSRFGTYTGNANANGPFVFCGFRPAFVMVKRTTGTGNWAMLDDKRPAYNLTNLRLQANTNVEEAAGDSIDILANGFKLRTTGADSNASAVPYVFIAFAENPFKYALAR